jgi:hypothetical protein
MPRHAEPRCGMPYRAAPCRAAPRKGHASLGRATFRQLHSFLYIIENIFLDVAHLPFLLLRPPTQRSSSPLVGTFDWWVSSSPATKHFKINEECGVVALSIFPKLASIWFV